MRILGFLMALSNLGAGIFWWLSASVPPGNLDTMMGNFKRVAHYSSIAAGFACAAALFAMLAAAWPWIKGRMGMPV